MFQFFESLFNIISSAIDFILNTFSSVIDLFQNAVLGINFMTLAVALMPGFLQPILIALIGVAVIKLVLNMGGN